MGKLKGETAESRHLDSIEKEGHQRDKRRKIIKASSWPLLPCLTLDTAFPFLLAASLRNLTHQDMFVKYLKKLHFHIISQPIDENLLIPLVSLIPSLLKSRNSHVTRRAVEIAGAISLQSLQMNTWIVSDVETVTSLVALLGSSSQAVSIAVCNTLVDFCTTSCGRQQLLMSCTLERVLVELFQVSISSPSIALSNGMIDRDDVKIVFSTSSLIVSLIHVAIVLIKASTVEQLEKTPRTLLKKVFSFFKSLWLTVHELLVHRTATSHGKRFRVSHIKPSEVAESLFRLSITVRESALFPLEKTIERIFQGKPDFETFISRYWEVFPYHVRGPSSYAVENDEVFAPFAQFLGCQESSQSFLRSMLEKFTSCPPMASDELDILNYLDEVRMELGSPLIYKQDIRVLRTETQSRRELHFFNAITHQPEQQVCFTMPNIIKCEEAFSQGYTIALRGMEFRLATISSISDALASLFGQPSTGCNMYVTPSNFQGLARHFDDHCVFVFQLFGTKHWKLYPNENFQLPRLYNSLSTCDFDDAFLPGETIEFLLRPGDVLYIPRGVAHEAFGGPNGPFSLHLTCSIELEPANEWEGFTHVALCWWQRMRYRSKSLPIESTAEIFELVSVSLLHAMIEHIGASEPTFKRACLVGSFFQSLNSSYSLTQNQKATFKYLINKIESESYFSYILSEVETAFNERRDPFHQMSWLHLLKQDQQPIEENDWNTPFKGIERLLPLYLASKHEAEITFLRIKAQFCCEIEFEDVICEYNNLLQRYKKTRMQYAAGMLSLHNQ